MKPKVLFAIHLPPPVHGAGIAGTLIKESQFINKRFDNYFINITLGNSLVDLGKIRFKKFYDLILIYIKILKALKNNKFELCFMTINSKNLAWYKELLMVFLIKLYHVQIIYFYHNKGVSSNSNTAFNRLLYQFQFKNTKTILLSPILFSDVQNYLKPSDVFYCPYGIKDQFQIKLKEFNNEKSNIPIILFLSNLIESKGVYVLLDACKVLKDKNISFKCIYVGGEGDITAIQLENKVRQMDLHNNVYYQGKKYGIEKEIAFHEADIFAFPTFYHNECFPIVNLEAMKFALPIISTFEGAVPEMILDEFNGYVVPQKNVELLAEKLEILISNPEIRHEMGRAGKKMFEEKFTLEIFERRIVEIFQMILIEKIA